MGNLLTRCARGLLVAVFLIGSASAVAETIAATPFTNQPVSGWQTSGGVWYSTQSEGCTAQLEYSHTVNQYLTQVNSVPAAQTNQCFISNSVGSGFNITIGVINSCGQSGYPTNQPSCSGYTCPDSTWTLSGSTCTRPDCEAGFDRDASGQCVKDCTGKAGMSTVNGIYSFSGAVSEWAVGGCKVHCAIRVLTGYGGSGRECKFTGASASPTQPEAEAEPPDPENIPPDEPEDCTSKGMGYISGSTGITCVPAEDAPDGQKPTSVEEDGSKETGTDADGDGKPDSDSPDWEKEETTSKTGSDGKTTTTTTSTRNGTDDGNGGITCPAGYTVSGDKCTKTTVTEQDTSSFCAENPTAAACKDQDDSSFSGDCQNGFSCEGDAATCAAAKASWELRCTFAEDSTSALHDKAYPGGTPEQIAAGQAALNADGAKNFNIADKFIANNQAWLNYASSCPVGVQSFTIGGQTLTLDGTMVCDIGLFVRLLVHILAYMTLVKAFAKLA